MIYVFKKRLGPGWEETRTMSFRDSQPKLRQYLAFAGFLLMIGFNNDVGIAGKHHALQEPIKKTAPDSVAEPPQDADAMDQLRRGIRRLTTEVERLASRVSDLEKERLFDVTRVLLVGEEQRAEALQSRLRESLERQFALQTRMEQVDSQLKPENIERMFIGFGMVRPEEARDTVRRRLGLEKQGIMTQLELLRQERNRYQTALATADMVIQRLRLRLAEAGRP
jgi:hypothetical protein